VLSILLGSLAAVSSAAAAEEGSETWTVPGLKSTVEILVDRWGVPHIYANNQDDLFFAQGFNAARDRLWQLDLWRRRGEGLLSEVLGPDYVEQDRAARLLLFRGDMHAEWLAYASDTKRIVTAFAAGVNAFIDLVSREPDLLPPEFELLDYLPSRWSPESVVRIRSHGLLRNVTSEVARANLLHVFGPSAVALRDRLEPAHRMNVVHGLDLSTIQPEVLRVYRLGTSAVRFPGATSTAGQSAELLGELYDDLAVERGSNNWAVAPWRTATGRPLLADDPHRRQAVPSLRYIVHLSAPGIDVIGAGEPALPGVSIGHNGHIAFGLTIFSIDQEDLYVYETQPGNATEYRYREAWESFETVREKIPVRGSEPVEVELEFSRHGPVLLKDPERRLAFALRAAWLQPGMAPYLGSIEYMRAKNWDEFLAAMNRWGAPSENQVYADVDGNIGWKPGGLAPIRPNWDGLLPVPGDGTYEWAGFLDMDELPVEFNPARGWVASANQMNLPEGYSHQLGWEWRSPFRYGRIVEVLAANAEFSVADSVRLQADSLSLPARRLRRVLREVEGESEAQDRALDLLGAWNSRLEASSAAAALFEIWLRRHLGPRVLAAVVAEDESLAEKGSEGLPAIHPQNLLDILEAPDSRLGDDPEGLRAEILRSSLEAAVAETEELLGDDWSVWRWGDLHQIELRHPLSERMPRELRARSDIGPLPRSGSGDTVGNTGYRGTDFRQVSGASFRMVIDVGEWDNSVAMNNPGQSGDPRSEHYRDLFEPWAAGEAFPLLYSRDRIEEETTKRIRLQPEQGVRDQPSGGSGQAQGSGSR